jgi:hypothetical protein
LFSVETLGREFDDAATIVAILAARAGRRLDDLGVTAHRRIQDAPGLSDPRRANA